MDPSPTHEAPSAPPGDFAAAPASPAHSRARRWPGPPVLYPDRYAWYVLASTLDIVVTVVVLVHYGAREVNSFAQASIALFDTWGLIGLKFLSLVLVISICEFIGRRRLRLGRVLATLAIVFSLAPVCAAITQVFWLWGHGEIVYSEGPWVE